MLNDGIAVMYVMGRVIMPTNAQLLPFRLVERGMGIGHDLSFIPSGVHAIIPLSATRYEFINDPPRILCEKDVDPSFSRVWCFDYCRMERAETRCNCSMAPSPKPRHEEICTPK
jgi:hypothetical protein